MTNELNGEKLRDYLKRLSEVMDQAINTWYDSEEGILYTKLVRDEITNKKEEVNGMSEKDLDEMFEEAIDANIAISQYIDAISGLADALEKIGKYDDKHDVKVLATEISLKTYDISTLLRNQHSAIVDAREEIDIIDTRSKYDEEDDD